jgi:hypothetical protein
MKLTKHYIKQLILETIQKEAIDPKVTSSIEVAVKAALQQKQISADEGEVKKALDWYFQTKKVTAPTPEGATNFVLGWLGKGGLTK